MSEKKSTPIGSYPSSPELTPLQKGSAGVAEVVAEIAGSYIPGVNLAKEKILENYVRKPLEERRARFFDRIAEGLEELERRLEGFDPANLENNEDFISAVYEASQAAMKSSREEKRTFLANAILNTAAGIGFDEVVRGSYLQMIEKFSILHIDVLNVYKNPAVLFSLFEERNISISGAAKDLIKRYYDQRGVSSATLDRVFNDIDQEHLVSVYALRGTLGEMKSLLSSTGEDFLSFISSPV